MWAKCVAPFVREYTCNADAAGTQSGTVVKVGDDGSVPKGGAVGRGGIGAWVVFGLVIVNGLFVGFA